MTRGRKKDLTIPPSRALTQQRDYRARKAQYISSLEYRVKAAEEENLQLKRELELAKAGLPPTTTAFTKEAAQLSTDLLQQLSATEAVLSQFRQLAFPELVTRDGQPNQLTPSNTLRPASFPSPAPSPPSRPYASSSSISRKPTHPASSAHPQDQSYLQTIRRVSPDFARESLSPMSDHSSQRYSSPRDYYSRIGAPRHRDRRWVDPSSSRDDDDLDDEDMEDVDSDHEDSADEQGPGSFSRTSRIRSTSDTSHV